MGGGLVTKRDHDLGAQISDYFNNHEDRASITKVEITANARGWSDYQQWIAMGMQRSSMMMVTVLRECRPILWNGLNNQQLNFMGELLWLSLSYGGQHGSKICGCHH